MTIRQNSSEVVSELNDIWTEDILKKSTILDNQNIDESMECREDINGNELRKFILHDTLSQNSDASNIISLYSQLSIGTELKRNHFDFKDEMEIPKTKIAKNDLMARKLVSVLDRTNTSDKSAMYIISSVISMIDEGTRVKQVETIHGVLKEWILSTPLKHFSLRASEKLPVCI
ncbi:hypothetical protein PV328_001303 [Microctonus aethiopoides]|uniref:Uncharacterized protein n=1 Tax=Microctonus aethiopoides TaxID=144406 RepID=A0AA39FWM8_9HYME|nr:hypothetical protein PV328_001303 [Microctonus aethiopoides]